MAAFTSKATGNWSASGQTTWNEAGTPGSGDTATIQNTHVVTVDTNTTCAGVTVASGSELIIGSGIVFTITGNSSNGNAPVTFGANSVLEMDPGAGTLKWTRGTANSQPNSLFRTSGTSAGNPAIIRRKSGATGYCWFEDFGEGVGNFDCGSWDMQYATFLNITKSDGTLAIRVSTFGSDSIRFRNTTFDGCGTITWFYDQTDVVGKYLQFADCKWQNSPSGSICLNLKLSSAAALSDTYALLRCSFDKTLTIAKGIRLRVKDCMFDDHLNWTGSGTGAEFTQMLMRATSNSQEFSTPVAISNGYWLHDQTTGNPHYFQLNSPDLTPIEGNVFDYPHPQAIDPGDCILGKNVGTITVQNNLVVPSYSDGYTSGYLCNLGSDGSGSSDITVTHNTAVGKQAAICFVKDPGYTTDEHLYPTVKSNIASSQTGSGADYSKIVFDFELAASQPSTRDDIATGANCTHNGIRNGKVFTDTTNGSAVYTGYWHQFPTSGTPGSNDVLGDPMFVDDTRNFATWAVYKGAANSGDSLATKLSAARILIKADPTLTYTDLIPWVRAGYAPTNAAYQAAHDNVSPSFGWIGAVEGQAGGTAALPLIGGGLINTGLINGGVVN